MKRIVTSAMEIGDNEIFIDGYVHYHVETNCFSDADGNRGVQKIFVDDVTDIVGYTRELGNIGLTENDKYKAGEILVREFFDE